MENSLRDDKQRDAILLELQKIMTILAERLIALRRILTYNRRLSWNRIKQRRTILRLQYFHQLSDIQRKFLLHIPRPLKKPPLNSFPNSGFWDDSNGVNKFSDEEWLDTFRMSKETFQWICNEIQDEIAPKCSSARNHIPLDKRVAMAILKLASGLEYKNISNLFGVARTTVCKFVRLFCLTICKKVDKNFVTMPTFDEAEKISEHFRKITNLSSVVGAVGMAHIPVTPSMERVKTFLNTDGKPSIVLQALVDHNLRFRKINVHSRNASLFTESAENLPQDEMNGILPFIAGTASYPLQPWLMKEYNKPKGYAQKEFNSAIKQINEISIKAFTRLFARWRILTNKDDIEHRSLVTLILTCASLHNIVETRRDEYNENWPKFEDFQPKITSEMKTQDTEAGRLIRNAITSKIHTGMSN